MKNFLRTNPDRGMTLLEVLVVIVVLGILVAMFLPAIIKMKQHDQRVQCVNNLKQVGLSFRVWEGDHSDKYPMNLSQTNGVAMEFITGPYAWRHFQILSNQLSAPSFVVCPADSSRRAATNFASLRNPNLSYFASVNATNENNPEMFLAGDRNLTNGTPIAN
jgi:prepilin-type N-terminal cleavage/methylation domain-containing protein